MTTVINDDKNWDQIFELMDVDKQIPKIATSIPKLIIKKAVRALESKLQKLI